MSEVKPQEIEAITLDRFEALVDKVIETLDENKRTKEVVEEKIELLEPASSLLKETSNESKPEIIGGSVSSMMIGLYDINSNKYNAIYSNAVVCSKKVALNPTTVRQRASNNKIIENIQWKYLNEEEYNKL